MPRAWLPIAFLLLFVLVVGADGVDDEMDWALRQELEHPLKTRASDIYDEKNEEGRRYQRANYAKDFHKVDAETYQVAFTKDIASKDKMRTERYLLTLNKSGSRWVIGEEELQDTYEKLIREMPGDEKFYRFDSFELDREGLKLSCSDGSAVVDFLGGMPNQIMLTGSPLTYDYEPPLELSYHQSHRYKMLKKEHSEDFDFKPQGLVLDCDGTTCQEILDRSFTGLREATHDDLHSELRSYFDNAINDQRVARRERPFSGFRLPYEPERRTFTAAVKRSGHDQWLWLYYDNEQPWEVFFGASGYGPIFGYPSAETRSEVAPYDLELREDFGARDIDITGLNGTVEAALGDAELLKADITYTMTIKRDLREIPFSLYNVGRRPTLRAAERQGTLTVNALQTGDGQDLTWVRRGGSGGLVVLPETVPAGTEIVLRMAYESEGSIKKVSPSYSYVNREGWLPFVRLNDRIDEFELIVKAPSRFKTISVGTKISEKKQGGVTTTHWKASSPVGFPTVIFGDYMEDTPKTVAQKIDGTEIPVTVHVDMDAFSNWGIRPGQLRAPGEQAVNALNIYREIYGVDYPYGKLDLVNDADFWGAQAPASIVYVASGAFRSGATMQQWTGAQGDWYVEMTGSMVAHEVGHQWWGWMFTHANQRNYWFIESLAEYSSALVLEIVESEGYKKPEKGRKAYLDHVRFWRDEILESDLMTSVQESSLVWGGENGFGSYRALVYSKGPYAFHILRETFGDEKFFAFLKNLGQGLAGQRIVTRDLQRVAEESFGGTMEWFFDQWIRGVGIPEYSFFYGYRQTEDGNFVVEGKIKQRVVAGLKKHELEDVYYRGIIPVTVLGRDSKEYPARVLVEGQETPFAFKIPVEPLEIAFNKYGEILAHPTLDNQDW
jgi:hypothetical protein